MKIRYLNLGCGNNPLPAEDFDNHDITKHREEINIVFDLNKFPYPIEDESYDQVHCYDVLEHLDNPLKVMNEIHRILKPHGRFKAKCCGWENPNLWVDITHKRGFDINSMDYFDPETELGKIYSYYTSRKWKIENKHYDKRQNAHFIMRKI